MTPLKCDLCGSNDVVKDGEYFVCQYCGTKYTIETARQMMFGGTVRVDHSAQIQNYITLARRAKMNGNNPHEYLNKALELDANDPAVLELEKEIKKDDYIRNATGDITFLSSRIRSLHSFTEQLDAEEKEQFISELYKSYLNGLQQSICGSDSDSAFFTARPDGMYTHIVEKEAPLWEQLGRDGWELRETLAVSFITLAKKFYTMDRDQPHGFGFTSHFDDDAFINGLNTSAPVIAGWTTSLDLKKEIYEILIKCVKSRRNDCRRLSDSGTFYYSTYTNKEWRKVKAQDRTIIRKAERILAALNALGTPTEVPMQKPLFHM